MEKKFLLLVFALTILLCNAEIIDHNYYLNTYYPIINNKIDVLKQPKGYSFKGRNLPFFNSNKITINEEIDFENEIVIIKAKYGQINLSIETIIPFDNYINNIFKKVFYEKLYSVTKEFLTNKERSSGEGFFSKEYTIPLPKMALPKSVRKFMGNKAARIRIDGSQKLTISGISSVFPHQEVSEGKSNSSFSPEMLQELNLTLNGTIGDRIHVVVVHHSGTETSGLDDPNNIIISYEGKEDEIIQTIEGGNTSLSVSGTKSKTVSLASSSGLFGVKTDLKFGDLEVTALIGKEESQRNKISINQGGETDSTDVNARNYKKLQYFTIEDPRQLFVLDTAVQDSSMKISTDANGAWFVNNSLLPIGNVIVFLDDGIDTNNSTSIIGFEEGDNSKQFDFDRLTETDDYLIDLDLGIISFISQISDNSTVGIIYQTATQNFGSESQNSLEVKIIKRKQSNPQQDTWFYELRNIYSMGGTNYEEESFKIEVYRNNNNTQETFDDNGIIYNDYLGFSDDTANDNAVDRQKGIIIFPYLQPFYELDVRSIYENSGASADEQQIYIKIIGKGGGDSINLKSMNILRGSVHVKTVDGDKLEEGVDYSVDYDFGNINLISFKAKNSKLEIDFENIPLFAIESKTMMAVRADMSFNDYTRVGGTFIYHSETVADQRPKIGSENKIQILGEMDGEIKFNPPFMTKMIDFLPFIETDRESELSISGEIAMNVPKIFGDPDKKDDPEAYFDDMEAVVNSNNLGISRPTWFHSSKPADIDFSKADIFWYNPTDKKANQVYDSDQLTDDEKDDNVQILRCEIEQPDIQNGSPSWSGMMKFIGTNVDLSNKTYIEIMLKADNPINVHIDLGSISEDSYLGPCRYWDKSLNQLSEITNGEGILNREDGLIDGFRDGFFTIDEDIGIDGLTNQEEYNIGISELPGKQNRIDHDDWFDKTNDDYSGYINTQGNNRLDSEDLDGDGELRTADNYFRYTFHTNNNAYLESMNSNGYRTYRIPMQDFVGIKNFTSGADAELDEISFARLWFQTSDLDEKNQIEIVKFEIVGNKWEAYKIKDDYEDLVDLSFSTDEFLSIGVIDNQNFDHYKSPKGTTEKKDGKELLEQSLTVEYSNLKPTHTGLAHQKFFDKVQLLGYKKLRYWVYPELLENDTYLDSIDLVFRCGSDSTNFYEVTKRTKAAFWSEQMVEENWQEIEIDFSDFTGLKATSEYENMHYAQKTDGIFRYSVLGNPSLNNIRDIAVGLKIPGKNGSPFTGKIYFNDIRVAEPFVDIGYTARSNLNLKFADFIKFNFSLEKTTPNFYGIISRQNLQKGFYNDSQIFKISNNYYLGKFFPISWGITIPLDLNYTLSKSESMYKLNSDILVEDIYYEDKEKEAEEKGRQKSETITKTASIGFKMSKTPESKILEYTLKNFTFNGSVTSTEKKSASSIDTTLTYSETFKYNLKPSADKIDIPITENFAFYYFPKSFDISANFKATEPNSWKWQRIIVDNEEDTEGYVFQTNSRTTRTLKTSTKVNYDLFTGLKTSYDLSTDHDLMQKNYFKSINIGLQEKKNQKISIDYNFNVFDKYFSLNTSTSASYSENQKEDKTASVENEEKKYLINGSTDRRFDISSTIKNKIFFTSIFEYFETKAQNKNQNKTESIEENENESKTEDSSQKENLASSDLLKSAIPEETINLETEHKEIIEKELSDKPEENLKIAEETGQTEVKTEEQTEEQTEVQPVVKNRVNLFGSFCKLLSNFDNITLSYGNKYTQKFDNHSEKPNFDFQIGIPYSIKNEDLQQKTNTDSYNIKSGIKLFQNLNISAKYAYGFSKNYIGSIRETYDTTFPDISSSYSNFHSFLGLSKFVNNSSITSSYSLKTSEKFSFDNVTIPDSRVETLLQKNINSSSEIISLTPASVNFSLIHNLSIDASYSIQINENKNYTLGTESNCTKGTSNTLRTNLGHKMTAKKGIKFPFIRKKLYLNNEFTTNISFTHKTDYKEIIRKDEDPRVDQDITSNTFTLSGSYKFHKNITGGSSFTYEAKDDKKNVQTTFVKNSMEIWVLIKF